MLGNHRCILSTFIVNSQAEKRKMYLHDTEGFSARVRRTKRRQG